MWTGEGGGALAVAAERVTFPRSSGSLDIRIDLEEFMFGFQWLFKSKDQHQPEYLLASALWVKFLEQAVQLPLSIGVNTDV